MPACRVSDGERELVRAPRFVVRLLRGLCGLERCCAAPRQDCGAMKLHCCQPLLLLVVAVAAVCAGVLQRNARAPWGTADEACQGLLDWAAEGI